jgi:2-iminobutanoate/2-iminopropanoate deaminase
METATTASKVKTFNLGASSEYANILISQGYSVNGMIYISGQYAHDTTDAVTGVGDFEAQVRQTLKNIDRVLAGFNVTKSNIADMIIYLTNPPEQSGPLVPLLQEYMGEHRPAATVIGVTSLWYPEQLIEIRVVAHTEV